MRSFNYQQAINFLDSFTNYEKVRNYKYNALYFSLKRMRNLLSIFDNPHYKLPSIHIAGTKGKGSTAIMISYILASAGYKVGLYVSPHLIDFKERVCILKKEKNKIKRDYIRSKEVVELTRYIKNRLESEYLPLSKGREEKYFLPTTFELYTLLAFIYFAQKRIDLAILETGMGGRLDATNVVKPLICVITSISYDHTRELGNTLKKIAREKAGIIKKESLVISANQRKEAKYEIFKKCQKEKAQLWEIDRDIKIVPFTTFTKFKSKYGQYFSLRGIKDNYHKLFLPLVGEYQMENAALAIGAIELLTECGFKISKSDFANGLKQLSWWGRFQIIDNKPMILLDGAHNQDSAENLQKMIKKIFPKKKILLILSIFKDKDAAGICKSLLPKTSEIVLTQVNSPRVMSPEELLKLISKMKLNTKKLKINLIPNAVSAFNYALSWEKDGLVLITGSLYLVGEALNFFQINPRAI